MAEDCIHIPIHRELYVTAFRDGVTGDIPSSSIPRAGATNRRPAPGPEDREWDGVVPLPLIFLRLRLRRAIRRLPGEHRRSLSTPGGAGTS
ncbi:MAG: hypothetical protein C4551_03650 [Bacillota bacterium]|nr:MAG: hypothetical protein C4551_03650 [Bacillota bacterium]